MTANEPTPESASGPAPQPVPTPRPSWWVAEVCAECSYDLRGLSVEGVCPECGVEIAKSVPLPIHAWPKKLRNTISAGAWMAAGGNTLITAILSIAVAWDAVDDDADWNETVEIVLIVLIWAMIAVGWWLMARARNVDHSMARQLACKRLAMDAWAFAVSGACIGAIVIVMNYWRNLPDKVEIAASITAICCLVLSIAAYGFGHVRSLDVAQTVGSRRASTRLPRVAKIVKLYSIFALIGAMTFGIAGAVVLDNMGYWRALEYWGYGIAVVIASIWGSAAIVLWRVGCIVRWPREVEASPAPIPPTSA